MFNILKIIVKVIHSKNTIEQRGFIKIIKQEEQFTKTLSRDGSLSRKFTTGFVNLKVTKGQFKTIRKMVVRRRRLILEK